MEAPKHLNHKPIIAVNDYDKIDAMYIGKTDAKALSVGQAQYEDFGISVKIWRHSKERWKKQSEEMPIHRALDLSILSIAAFLTDTTSKYPLTCLREEIVQEDRVNEVFEYYKKNKSMLKPRLEELQKILNTFFEREKKESVK